MSTKSMNLAEALPAEMARVRDEVLPLYDEIPAGVYAAAMMRKDLNAAGKAIMDGDVVAMLRCYEMLREYEA